jgi:hypothetical protein
MIPKGVVEIRRELCKRTKCEADFENPCAVCPNGHWGRYENTGCDEQGTGLGDVVASIAQPIAKGLDKILGTDIQNCGGCKQRREKLNKIHL